MYTAAQIEPIFCYLTNCFLNLWTENVKLEVDSIHTFEEWKKNQMEEETMVRALIQLSLQ